VRGTAKADFSILGEKSMDKQTIREVNELIDVAHLLGPLERELLFNLDDKGPGLLLELAVRTLHFPEEVGEPLADLRHRGLVQSDNFEGGQFGNEIICAKSRFERDNAESEYQSPSTGD